HPFPASAVRTVGGVRIGFFGVMKSTQALPAQGVQAVMCEDTIESAKAAVAALKGEVDLVVALTHQGLAEDRDLASKVPGVDVIIGGHSREALGTGMIVGKTL